MQHVSKHTKFKVIGGYILLFLLSIFSTILIYKQITRLIVNEEIVSEANRKLFIIGNTITGLYEAEALSNAFVQTGVKGYFQKYMAIMDETEMNIDSLRNWTTHPEQKLRIDTISTLLEDKVSNLQDLVYVKRSFIPEEFYSKAIAHIESKDSLQKETNVQKRFVTTLDSSYVKSDKRKKRWLFFKAKPDSALKVSVSHHTIVDTLDASVRNTDTVVNILKSTWKDVQKQTQNIAQQINRKEYALIKQSTDITDQLKRILGEYEKEEINNALSKQQNRERTITTVIRIFAWVAVSAFLLVVFFTFFILRDLSLSQRYRRELENANKYADQLLKNREKIILTVTHDIKSPLSSVIGYIELLNHTAVNDRQRYFLKNMQGSSEHILKLIGNLLDLSKLENNKIAVEEIVFNPARLFQEITDNFIPLAAAKKLKLNNHFGKDLNNDFRGDALRIRQIITNILSNAVKYTTEGSIRFSATISTDDKQIILKIQDTGSGMTQEEQKIIFQEFTRLKSHSAIEGTGLGLTITLKLIGLLRGQIRLESEPGKGSCFTIVLPLQKVVSAPPSTTEPIVSIPIATAPGSRGLRIFLVDDDPLQLAMTTGLLENHGIHPDTTTDPGEVAGKLQSEPYDLVFTDIQMPGMSGFELVKQIRNLPTVFAKTLPIIALSADSEKQEGDYLQAGFTAYLGKPFTSDQLMGLVARMTGTQFLDSQRHIGTPPDNSNPTDFDGYTLRNILQFTDQDQQALQKILESFIVSTLEHIALLKKYQQAQQVEAIARLAHKMLPIFRQLEAKELIDPLQQLEHPDKESLSAKEINTLTETVIVRAEAFIHRMHEQRQ